MKKEQKEREYLLKITCKTPKNRANKEVATFKDMVTGFAGHKRVVAEQVIAHNKFILVVHCKDPKEMQYTLAKAAKSEVRIKKIYKIIIKVFDKLNKLAKKGSWGLEKSKRALVTLLKINGIEQSAAKKWASDAKVTNGSFEIKDRKDILALLAGDIITVEEYKENKNK